MGSVESFLEMGGYGGFVWPAFGLTAVLMVVLLLDSLRRLRTGRRVLERLEAQMPQRRRRGEGPSVGTNP